jgi:hypothetical protein
MRPDGYVGFRVPPLTCADLRSHLEGIFAASLYRALSHDAAWRSSTLGGGNGLVGQQPTLQALNKRGQYVAIQTLDCCVRAARWL